MLAVKYCKMPFIAAVKGFALGGGCELLLHSAGVIANIESNVGLVEMQVGLVPGWGGIKEVMLRE